MLIPEQLQLNQNPAPVFTFDPHGVSVRIDARPDNGMTQRNAA